MKQEYMIWIWYSTEMVPLIQECLKIAFSRQKSYAASRRRDIKFVVGDYVFLKMSPMKEVMRFRKKDKLAPQYVGLFKITDRVGTVAYRLEVPPNFSHIHPVFHIFMLRKYISDPSHCYSHTSLR